MSHTRQFRGFLRYHLLLHRQLSLQPPRHRHIARSGGTNRRGSFFSRFPIHPGAALWYYIRDARYTGRCQYSCPEELAGGIIHPDIYGDVQQPFTLRFDTAGIPPGPYMVHAEVLCSGETTERSFNILPEDTVLP